MPAGAAQAQVVWVTFDTPVREDDVADSDFVRLGLEALFPHIGDGTLVLVSSQVPVGFTAQAEAAFRNCCPGRRASFAYSPENLRLGKALDGFRRPERIVVGVRNEGDRSRLTRLLSPFCQNLEWMGVESAEMTKHALNAFLATSVSFINELATLCEKVGADAKEVERGLKTESRIGPKAYLSPGSAFAGGTLARDVSALAQIGRHVGVPTHLLCAVSASNNAHKAWPRRRLKDLLGELDGKAVAVLGLTYKPDTDTLRRSSAVELCSWLTMQGAQVRAYDPAIHRLPPELRPHVELCATASGAIQGADALVLATEWPAFRNISAEEIIGSMRTPIILDANRFVASNLGSDPRIRYVAVGKPASKS
ncbi:MAG: nucleotide sugar dehydrogenase [Acidobacteriota bacterium]